MISCIILQMSLNHLLLVYSAPSVFYLVVTQQTLKWIFDSWKCHYCIIFHLIRYGPNPLETHKKVIARRRNLFKGFPENEIKLNGNMKDCCYGKMSYFLNLVIFVINELKYVSDFVQMKINGSFILTNTIKPNVFRRTQKLLF